MTGASDSYSVAGRVSRLPFARPTIGEDEIAEVVSALRSGGSQPGPGRSSSRSSSAQRWAPTLHWR